MFGMHRLYEWTHADVVAKDELLRKKALYLNTPFFLMRTALAFAVWLLLAYFLTRLSRAAGRRSRTTGRSTASSRSSRAEASSSTPSR